MTKGMAAMLVYTTKECNYSSIVVVHQHGGYDIIYKPRIVGIGCTLAIFHSHKPNGRKDTVC